MFLPHCFIKSEITFTIAVRKVYIIALKITITRWLSHRYSPFLLFSGHGVILEGAVVDISRHVITDKNNRKVTVCRDCIFIMTNI